MSYSNDLARKLNKLPTEAEEKVAQQKLTSKIRPRQEYFGFEIPKDREFFTPEEIGRLLLFSTQTVWRWCRIGRIPTYRVGRFYRVSVEDLADLVKQRQVLCH